MNYLTLRDANIARQEEWDKDGHAKDWSWRCNELAGEAGEVCNILKKLHRERLGVPGSRATKDQLAEELADVIICVDLCAMHMGFASYRYAEAILPEKATLGAHPLPDYGNSLIAAVGRVCGSAIGLPDALSRDTANNLRSVMSIVRIVAFAEKIDLDMAVSHKFNATSAKVGLRTTLNADQHEMDYGDSVSRY